MKMRVKGAYWWALLCLLACVLAAPVTACTDWPQWERFRSQLISADGRVIDYSRPERISTSEGQSYAMFFALVADDRETFDRLLRWTNNNLADGSLAKRLPAWLWGNDGAGTWRVLDDNAASDADMWMAYVLLEAARLWNEPGYRELGESLAQRILAEESAVLPGLGEMLMPGPMGFTPDERTWRLNPSYLPIPLLRYLGKTDPRWHAIADNSLVLLRDTSPRGFTPDWVAYRLGEGFVPDANNEGQGSYDAIRVYLWAGMTNRKDPAWPKLRRIFAPMRDLLAQHRLPPRQMNPLTGQAQDDGPVGFSAAMLPMLSEPQNRVALINQLSRLLDDPPWEGRARYYDQVLTLFGLGWHQGRYRFDKDGRLQRGGDGSCS